MTCWLCSICSFNGATYFRSLSLSLCLSVCLSLLLLPLLCIMQMHLKSTPWNQPSNFSAKYNFQLSEQYGRNNIYAIRNARDMLWDFVNKFCVVIFPRICNNFVWRQTTKMSKNITKRIKKLRFLWHQLLKLVPHRAKERTSSFSHKITLAAFYLTCTPRANTSFIGIKIRAVKFKEHVKHKMDTQMTSIALYAVCFVSCVVVYALFLARIWLWAYFFMLLLVDLHFCMRLILLAHSASVVLAVGISWFSLKRFLSDIKNISCGLDEWVTIQ